MKAVVLLSGGLDSTTVLASAINRGHECYCLFIAYGQRHIVERQAARRVANHYTRPLKELTLPSWGGSVLTDDTQAVPDEPAAGIPPTYVPARNTILLAHALAYAEILEADMIALGVNHVDYSGYPDCRPKFVQAFHNLANCATKRAVEGQHLALFTPLLHMSKVEIVKLGFRLNVPYDITHSCYDPVQGLACGRCDSCRIRHEAFANANLPDPTSYGF